MHTIAIIPKPQILQVTLLRLNARAMTCVCVCVCVVGFGVWTVPESVRFVCYSSARRHWRIGASSLGAEGLPRRLGFSCMCTAWLPVVPVVGAAPLCLCLVPRWRRVLCDVRVVCWFDAFTAAWSGIAVGGWTNVARPLVLIVARVRYRGRLWVPVTKRRSSRACIGNPNPCLLYTSPSPRDRQKSRMPSSA